MILCQVKFGGLAWTQELKEELCDIMELCTIFRYSFICRSAHACTHLGVSTFGACARSDREESSRVTVAGSWFRHRLVACQSHSLLAA